MPTPARWSEYRPRPGPPPGHLVLLGRVVVIVVLVLVQVFILRTPPGSGLDSRRVDFDFDFLVQTSDQLKVERTELATGTVTPLTETIGYNLAINTPPAVGGRVTLTSGATAGDIYTIYRDEQIKQANRPSCTGTSVRRYVRSHASECVEAVNGHFNAYGKSWQIRRLPYERKRLTYDTIENRYIKWALHTLLRLVRKSMKKIRKPRLSETEKMIDWRVLLETTEQRLRKN